MRKESVSHDVDYKSLYNHTPCGLLTFRIDGAIIHCNQTLIEWLGTTEEEITKVSFTDLLNKGGKFYYQLFIIPLLRMHQEVKEINLSIETRDSSFHCLFSATSVNTGDEEVINAVIFKVVDRKKYEDELLSKKVKADKEKQRTSDALEMVAFAQSHLIRAPLANILGLIALLDEHMVDDELQLLNMMLKASAMQLDAEIQKIVDTATSKE